ncbi:hypothetical protein ACFOUP_12435 [Belliella kenyensis]|uniref:Uncharacterized protein n=1 Tax=Belliella kenyensis TaxID=1472724 RepID=A0ABV8ENC3_9BACT|nr:hypothetical protein [Belliella kenyensis]MCH7400779.1 hypothetical protein [Belliella kenyensis]MDN3601933.1 hypothetical protein [Belliella kenyensis]
MKNYVKTSKWLRWVATGAFCLMLVLNIMVSLEFEKGKLLPSITLTELGNSAMAQSENGGGGDACLDSYHNQSNSTRSESNRSKCYNADGESCGNQEICEYSANQGSSCTDHVCSGNSSGF